MKAIFMVSLIIRIASTQTASVCQDRVSFSSDVGCPAVKFSSHRDGIQQCALLCTMHVWCVATTTSAGGACELLSAETVLFAGNLSCNGTDVVSRARIATFINDYLTNRNVTHKQMYVPGNSAKIFQLWQRNSGAASLVSCVKDCANQSGCSGIVFNGTCVLLLDFPQCRWFQQPNNSSKLKIFDFYTVNTSQCYETVNLRVSDSVDFDRLWADYKVGFGVYHDNYFAGLEWMHSRTSAQPSNNQFRVDLLYWNDDYVHAYYRDIQILSENQNYTVAAWTYAGGTLGNCLFNGVNNSFQTRDRSPINCAGNCAEMFQPHWHRCCHCSCPFGKYFNYPTALNVPDSDRAKGIIWPMNAPKNITDGFYYSFKQLEILMLT